MLLIIMGKIKAKAHYEASFEARSEVNRWENLQPSSVQGHLVSYRIPDTWERHFKEEFLTFQVLSRN